nr:YIP1 family protein [Cypionkella sp.]
MSITADSLIRAAFRTVQDPRAGARAILDMGLSLQAGLTALFLMAVCSTMLSSLTFLLSPLREDAQMAAVFGNPVKLAVLQSVILILVALLMHGVGRRFGGKGTLPGALALTAWLEFVLILFQVAQLITLAVPVIAEALGFVGFVVFLWMLTQFIMELHGFVSAVKVFASIIGTLFATSLILAVVLVILG